MPRSAKVGLWPMEERRLWDMDGDISSHHAITTMPW